MRTEIILRKNARKSTVWRIKPSGFVWKRWLSSEVKPHMLLVRSFNWLHTTIIANTMHFYAQLWLTNIQLKSHLGTIVALTSPKIHIKENECTRLESIMLQNLPIIQFSAKLCLILCFPGMLLYLSLFPCKMQQHQVTVKSNKENSV